MQLQTEENKLKKEIQDFWTKNVPGLDISSQKYNPEQKEFYEEADRYRFKYEPYVLPLLDSFCAEGKLILEIGCGLGSDSRYMSQKGVNIISLDLSPSNVSLTIKGMHLLDLKGKGVCADAERLPFKDNSFDVVYSFGVLHHTPNTQNAINEIYRILKPQGSCFLMLYHKGYAYYLIRLYSIITLKYLFKPEEKLISDLYDQTPLSKMYSRNSVYQLFKKFKEIKTEVTTYGGIQNNKSLRWIYVILNKFPFLMKSCGTFIIIKTVK